MGHIIVKVKISNIQKTKLKEVDGVVDTGATLSVIPEKLAKELGINITGESRVETGAGLIKVKKGEAYIAVEGKEELQPVIISDFIDKVLIGATTLQVLALKVDPINEKLVEGSLLLYFIYDRFQQHIWSRKNFYFRR